MIEKEIDNEVGPQFQEGDVVSYQPDFFGFGERDRDYEKYRGNLAIVKSVSDNRSGGWGVKYSLEPYKGDLPYLAWHRQDNLKLVLPMTFIRDTLLAKGADNE